MNNKINSIKKEVQVLSHRDIDYVNKNTKDFSKFLIEKLNLSQKKSILLFMF